MNSTFLDYTISQLQCQVSYVRESYSRHIYGADGPGATPLAASSGFAIVTNFLLGFLFERTMLSNVWSLK
jgi:hypothetical protein